MYNSSKNSSGSSPGTMKSISEFKSNETPETPGTIIIISEHNAIIINDNIIPVPSHEIMFFMDYNMVAEAFIFQNIRYIITKPYPHEKAIILKDLLDIRHNAEGTYKYRFFIRHNDYNYNCKLSNELVKEIMY